VAVVVTEAIRRARRKRAEASHLVIDETRPLDAAELGARPQEEASNERSRLESEQPDISTLDERW
jgi:hypothetical protein